MLAIKPRRGLESSSKVDKGQDTTQPAAFRDFSLGTSGINFLFSRNANCFSVKILSMKSSRVGKDWREGGCCEMRLDVGKCKSAGLRQRVTGQTLAATTQRNELCAIIVTGQVSSFPDQKRTGAGGQRRQSGLWVPG